MPSSASARRSGRSSGGWWRAPGAGPNGSGRPVSAGSARSTGRGRATSPWPGGGGPATRPPSGWGGLTVAAGRPGPFLSLVAPHGVLELSVIAVSGAAGFSVGWALIDPGRRSRRVALGFGARRGAEIVLGTMPWFVLAGLVEGFVTPTSLPLAGAIAVGLLVAAPYWTLVFWRGRPEPAPA